MPLTQSYTGVILAAGKGSRITPLSLSIPKPLLPICNKPIIQYQIEAMACLGIRKIFIVCGQHQKDFEKCFAGGESLGVELTYVTQENPLGIAHALARVEGLVKSPFLLFLGDIVFFPLNLYKMVDLFEKRGACAILAVKRETDHEAIKRNYAVMLHESGLVKRVIEKPRYISNDLKGCGIYFFDLPIFDAVRRTPRTAMRDEYELTSSIQMLIDDGYPVYPAEAIEWDANITIVADLLEFNLKMLDLQHKESEIGANAVIHPDAHIMHSVIGQDVVIEQPVHVIDSVILPGTRITQEAEYVRCLVSSSFQYSGDEKVIS